MKKSQSPIRYVALLRGINVGGNNVIRMADLRACFESLGFADVATYIQSGNVVFSAAQQDHAARVAQIETALSTAFDYVSRVALVDSRALRVVIEEAPAGFGTQPEEYRYDVVFVLATMTAAEVARQMSLREGVDTLHAGSHAVYFRRLISRATQSHLTRIAQMPVYKHVTIRNWNTTQRLAEMVAG